jgi:AraC family transcriptional regulator
VSVGSLAIYPAGNECGVEVKESVDALIVAIDPDRLALAAAESSALGAQLTERLSGYDEVLFDLARNLALEGAADYPNGAHTGMMSRVASLMRWSPATPQRWQKRPEEC